MPRKRHGNDDERGAGDALAARMETAPDEASFEELLGRLDAVVRRLESGELGLDGSIAAFESGVGIVKRLQERLAAAEARVHWLVAEVESAAGADPAADPSSGGPPGSDGPAAHPGPSGRDRS
jgi:exodeoxyribonuclease VII small subunit